MRDKVYTLTFHHAHNFGAMLQAYALQHFFLKAGADAAIIDYNLETVSLFPQITHNNLKKMVKDIGSIFFFVLHLKSWKSGFEKFEAFYKENLVKTKKFMTLNELKEYDFNESTVVVGSDQVWNFKKFEEKERVALLEFAENASKYSYAASMGNVIPQGVIKEEVIKRIRDYCGLSVREAEVVSFFQNGGISVQKHIDPVFLLSTDEWRELAANTKKTEREKYIFCYDLVKSDKTQVVLDKLKKKYGYKTVVITRRPHTELIADKVIRDAGPKEFLEKLINSECVVTTSFHGAAFSILFKKNFYAIRTTHSPNRIIELLELFGLESQIIQNELVLNEADFSNVEGIIEEERMLASEYLLSMLK